jgi:putative addiction module component (TIGR02574 family)
MRRPRENIMATSLDELETEVLSLSPTDRTHLLERLLESFEPASDVEDIWVAEALRREAEVDSGEVELVPATEAIARVRALLT